MHRQQVQTQRAGVYLPVNGHYCTGSVLHVSFPLGSTGVQDCQHELLMISLLWDRTDGASATDTAPPAGQSGSFLSFTFLFPPASPSVLSISDMQALVRQIVPGR